jgi:FtsP/CotA-like multicopper oxidase with cupredoxin domain
MELTMRNRTLRSFAPLLAAAVLTMGLAMPAGAVTYYLRAAQTTLAMPDGANVTVWGYALDSGPAVDDGTVTVPGPRLTVPVGDSNLTVILKNRLPVIPGIITDTSLMIPSLVPDLASSNNVVRGGVGGNRIISFQPVTAPGGNGTYSWSNVRPGTFLYQSGTHPQVQVQMGLYGAVVKDFSAGVAYDGVPYDQDFLVVFSEIDPLLHDEVAGGTYGTVGHSTSTMYYEPKYFLINGAAFPATTAFSSPASSRVLLRFLNAGIQSHQPMLPGLYMDVVAENGSALPYRRQRYELDLIPAMTLDALVNAPPQTSPCSFALFDRMLHLTNNLQSGGGMLTYVNLTNPSAAPGAVGPTLMATKSGTSMTFTWGDVAGADFYKVYMSPTATPQPFAQLAAQGSSGVSGATLPMPAGSLVFFKVAGAGTCGGEGPQN